MAADPGKVIAPAPEDEARLWSLLEAAWARLGEIDRTDVHAVIGAPPPSVRSS